MIEKVVRDYLNAHLNGVSAYLERPESKPQSYVLIQKTGSRLNNHLNGSTFAIRSVAPTLYGAASLNENVKAAMLEMIDLDDISRVSLNSDYNYSDGTTKEYRYQAVFDITHY